MLKLKKIHILGFKSFCDRTEVALPGTGIAVVVGPNGCGKSNILDGVTWVLGEQSAKTLRGSHMQDVIFAGTRDRKALGMAEVTITLVDPEAYEGSLNAEPEVVVDEEYTGEDWNEQELRKQRAEETEEIIAEAQPGQAVEGQTVEGQEAATLTAPEATGEATNAEHAVDTENQSVVLKIRRRKFQRTPQKGEIVVTRRLFRSGESEYLLNGKLCRLRDIQDIFMGTGLGPESYAIIGQERIGQLLSAKPHDRRSIIEEAAGITRFKTKKRLAELRLESAKQNLVNIDTLFDEITRQMNSLKRQAAKAERYGALRDELRMRLRVVIASRLAAMDAEQARLNAEISSLTTQVDTTAEEITAQEATQHELTERGYTIDRDVQQAQAQANEANVEIERAAARANSNQERVRDLDIRVAATAAELEQTEHQLEANKQELVANKQFLENASSEAQAYRQQVEARQSEARSAAQQVTDAERKLEQDRRGAMHLLSQAGNARNQTAQAEESLASLERESQRLTGEISQAKLEAENLGAERGQAGLRFESATEALKRLEAVSAEMRQTLQNKRSEENQLRVRTNQLRSEVATVSGRRNSLDSLIKNHSYSTDTVRKLLRPDSLGPGMTPVGTLADFLEVSGQHESVVDEFLRDELNYIVVKSWEAAEQGVRLLKGGTDGRATFLVHTEESDRNFTPSASIAHEGLTSLRETIRVLNGFGSSLSGILPKLGNGYVAPSAEAARRLSSEHPHAWFLSPEGECFHNATVTGGKPSTEGPLALKRELRQAEQRLQALEADLAKSEIEAATVTRSIEELTAQLEQLNEERRIAERDSANQGAALKQMEAEVQRIERRLQEWTLQEQRNKDAREQKSALIAQKQEEALRLEGEHRQAETQLEELQQSLNELRQSREAQQLEAARVTAELAGLEERRRGAEQSFRRIEQQHADLQRRIQSLEQQRAAAIAEREQRLGESGTLETKQQELILLRDEARTMAQKLAEESAALRGQLAQIEQGLRAHRVAADQLREQRALHSNALAKLQSDLEHLEAGTLAELNVEAAILRTEEITFLADEALSTEDEACRDLRQKLEAMGPVNMMALEEFKEAEERHGFLEAQRKDLIDSIENTQSTIKEIEQISRTKFDEAFARINENFSQVFTRLFHGGQAFLRLTDAENQSESGLEIVASPPGKKLQNVLLLSGGEKALTALSLLMGIFQYQPSPFCVLDEVDAALDETNVGRIADLLDSMSHDTQFLIVTHSKRMMRAADMVYGVTMQEPGVSKIVSVKLSGQDNRAQQRAS